MLRTRLIRHGATLLIVGLVFLVRHPIESAVGVGASPILYLPVVTMVAWYGGFGAGVAAVLMWGLLWVYFEIPPFGSLGIPAPADQLRMVVFLGEGFLVALVIAMLQAARRASNENAAEAERYRMASGRTEALLRSILDHSPAPIWVKDLEGRYLLASRRFEALARHPGLSVVGLTDGDLFLPRIAGPLHVNDRAVLEGKQAVEVEEVLLLDDEPHTFLAVKFPLLDAHGEAYALGGIYNDITALKEAQRRAVQAGRLAAIGQMVTGLAHESRNALQRSQACLEMLAFRLEGRPEALDLVAGIQDAQDDLQRLYEEVRCYAAPIHLDRRPVDLRATLREAWEHLEVTRRDRVAHLVEHGMAPYEFIGDRGRLIQVFRNVLDNALAAAADPVRVDVTWAPATLGDRPAAEVMIRDNGPGLGPEQRRNLFEPFFTTKTQGTGLGMAIARRIVEAHEGTIRLGGDRSPGAEIVITLPRSVGCRASTP